MDERAFRAEVRAELGQLLESRTGEAGFSFLGAGQDDLEAGRRLLATLADTGWAVPTWPREWGGRGREPAAERILSGLRAPFEGRPSEMKSG